MSLFVGPFKHQFLHFLFVFPFVSKIEHGPENMIPQGAANAIAIVLILIMMKVVIAP